MTGKINNTYLKAQINVLKKSARDHRNNTSQANGDLDVRLSQRRLCGLSDFKDARSFREICTTNRETIKTTY